MKSTFHGYYRPSPDEFTALWQNATFVLDANVLLNIYGYSARTRTTLLQLLRSIEARLWVPHQFALEYQRNRVKAISDQVTSYSSARRDLKKLLDQQFRVNHKHPFVGKKSLAALDTICQELEKGEREHEKLYSNDPYFLEISQMLEGKIGTRPTDEQFAQRCNEARARYASRTPPGYEDAPPRKPEPDAFGDYFGWYELLEHGVAEARSTILVTDDKKDDWWAIHGKDRRLGPRPELVAEYRARCGQQFYMYSLEEFMRHAQQYLGQRVTTSALQEVKDRSESQSEEASQAEKPLLPSFASEAKPVDQGTTLLSWDDDDEKTDTRPAKPEKP